MYLTDLEIEEYLKESPYEYFKNHSLNACERKIAGDEALVKNRSLQCEKIYIQTGKKSFQIRICTKYEF